MDLTYIHAVAAFSGSASGTLATVLTGLFTRRRKDRALRRSWATSQCQELYRSFVEEASRLYVDALVKDTSETSKLVDLYALIGRMRTLSSDEVIEAAEKTGRLIIETYLSPNKTTSVFCVGWEHPSRDAVCRGLVFSGSRCPCTTF